MVLLFFTSFTGVASAATQSGLATAQNRLATVEKRFGPQHLNTAMALQTLAEQFISQKKWSDAQPLLERALIIRKTAHGVDHPLVSHIQTTLARLYMRKGEPGKAVTLLESVVQSAQNQFGSQHIKTAQAQIDLAHLYRFDPKRQQEGVRLILEALPILESSLWKEHVRVADALHIMASADFAMGNLQKAKTSWLRALQIRENSYGSDHPKVAEILLELGRLQVSLRDIKQGEKLFKRAVEIFRHTVGEDAAQFADALEPLAELLVLLDRYEEALPLMAQILFIRENLLGKNHPRLIKPINDLALVLMEREELQKAKDAFLRALKIADGHFGSDHIQIAFIVGNLSEINQLLGDDLKAKKQFERSQKIARNFFAGDDIGLANWLSSIAATLHKSGHHEKASQLFNQSLALVKAEFGPDHPNVIQIQRSLKALNIPIVKELKPPSVESATSVVMSSKKAVPVVEDKPIQVVTSILMITTDSEEELPQTLKNNILADSVNVLRFDHLKLSLTREQQNRTAPDTPDVQDDKQSAVKVVGEWSTVHRDNAISNAVLAKKLMVNVGCFMPETLVPHKLMQHFEKKDLPFYSKASIIKKKIHSCISLGPLPLSQQEVETIMAEITNRFGLSNLVATEYHSQ